MPVADEFTTVVEVHAAQAQKEWFEAWHGRASPWPAPPRPFRFEVRNVTQGRTVAEGDAESWAEAERAGQEALDAVRAAERLRIEQEVA